MARDVVVRMLHLFRRLLLWCLLVIVLLTLPVMGMLGSETGSRWLLEQGLGMQRMLTLEVRGGTLLGGLDLAEVRLHTRKSDLYIRRVLARWSLLQLLRGEIDILELQADGVVLTLTSPPSRDPVRLPRLILPLALDIHSIELKNVLVRKRGSEWPVAHIAAKGYWRGATVTIDKLQAQEPRYGDLDLAGEIQLLGGYPLKANGTLAPRWLTEKEWQPLQVGLGGGVASLDITATSRGRYHADLAGNVRPLLPDIPYTASLKWSDLYFPWLTQHQLDSRKGQLKVIGDKHGLRSQGGMDLKTKYTPPVSGQWQLDMDWQHIEFKSLNISGLNGKVNAKGNLGWSSGLSWDATAELKDVDLARHWPVSRSVLPILTGTLISKGRSQQQDSSMESSLKLASGEYWFVTDKAKGVLWSPESLHKATANWRAVSRPVAGLKFVQSDNGQLVFEGRQSDYVAEFSGDMSSGLLPSGFWQGQAAGGGTHLNIETLSYVGDAGALQAGGELDFGSGIVWQGAVVLDDFESQWLLPEWSGQFSGSLSGRGEWSAARREFDLGDVNIAGQLRDQPLLLDGPIRVRLFDGSWPHVSSSGFKAEWAGNSVALAGGLWEQWDAILDLDIISPEVLMPALHGKVKGRVVLNGPERAPDVRVDLVAEQAAYDGNRVQSAQLQAVVPEWGNAQGNISLAMNGITTKSNVVLGDLLLTAQGVVGEHQLEWSLRGESVAVQGKLAGGLDRLTGNWQGDLQQGEVTAGEMQWLLSSEVPLSWNAGLREVQLSPHCWQNAPASLCISEPLVVGPSGHVAVSLKDFQAERLATFMPEGLEWLGVIAGEATADWRPGEAPTAKALFHTESGEVRLGRDDAEPLSLRYDHFNVAIDADASAINSRVTLASSDMGNALLEATINPFAENRPLTGEVTLSGLRLELLQPFLPALSTLTGLVSAEGRLDGSLAHPRYWGSLQLKDGKMALRNVPLAVDDMSAWIDVQGDRADISGQLRSGAGGAALSGQADWSDQPKVSLDLKGSRFGIRQEPEILAEVDPDLHIELQPGQVDLTGTVRVPYARINLKQLPERSVGLSADVIVLKTADGRLHASTLRRGQAMAINADVELILGDDVFINGFGVIGSLNGGLHMRQSAQRGLEAYGELGLDKDARYEAYGQKLKVRRGRLIFAGNISQPAIDAEAIREVDDNIVGIRVEGRANAPEATLFSEPSMPQADILAYLILGRPLAQRDATGGSTINDAMLASAAIKLGAKGGEGLTSGIGSIVGISDLSVDADGSGDDTQVKVSGYIRPDLYLSYGVGVFTPVNTITMRYQIRPRLYLEAVSALENAIDLFYNFRF